MEKERLYKRMYAVTFMKIRDHYRNFGEDYVKAQIDSGTYFNWHSDERYKQILSETNLKSNEEIVYSSLGIGAAIDDALVQIFTEKKSPKEMSYSKNIQVNPPKLFASELGDVSIFSNTGITQTMITNEVPKIDLVEKSLDKANKFDREKIQRKRAELCHMPFNPEVLEQYND